MPWISMIMKNLKLILITLAVSALITAGVGLYFHGKKVQQMSTQISLLESTIEQEHQVREILNEVSLENLVRSKELEAALLDANTELAKVKKDDKVSADYLDTPVPLGVRDVRERARCISLPYLCEPDGRE